MTLYHFDGIIGTTKGAGIPIKRKEGDEMGTFTQEELQAAVKVLEIERSVATEAGDSQLADALGTAAAYLKDIAE